MAVRKTGKASASPPIIDERRMAESVAEMFYAAHDMMGSRDTDEFQRGRDILRQARLASLQMDLRLSNRRSYH